MLLSHVASKQLLGSAHKTTYSQLGPSRLFSLIFMVDDPPLELNSSSLARQNPIQHSTCMFLFAVEATGQESAHNFLYCDYRRGSLVSSHQTVSLIPQNVRNLLRTFTD